MDYGAILRASDDQHPRKRKRGNSASPAPTAALPGTPEKTEILVQRRRDGEQLWHLDDARLILVIEGLRVFIRPRFLRLPNGQDIVIGHEIVTDDTAVSSDQ